MKKLCFILMLTLLTSPSLVKAAEWLKGDDAVEIMRSGKLVSEHWYEDERHMRYWLNGQYYACRDSVSANFDVYCFTPQN